MQVLLRGRAHAAGDRVARMTRKVITPRLHLALDVATIAVFAVSPRLFHFDASPRTLAYVLAVAHTLLTVAVESVRARYARVVGRIHAAVELIVAVALLLVPFVTSWSSTSRSFFGLAGGVILVVVACTDYFGRSQLAATRSV